MRHSIAAVILAGGASRRMERPKVLLRLDSKSFLQHCADGARAAGIRDVVIVLGAGHEEISITLGWFEGRVVVNEHWESGQLSSIVAGINAVEGSDHGGILIWPVDHPLVPAPLIGEMVQAFHASGKPIVVPVYDGRRGHPILLARTLFDEVRSAPPAIGLRFVIRAHDGGVCEVPTAEEGVLINIDTPDDYRRFVTMRPVQET